MVLWCGSEQLQEIKKEADGSGDDKELYPPPLNIEAFRKEMHLDGRYTW